MRLTCPNCQAQYEVADNVIPDEGRDVQCSNCGTTWFQDGARKLAAAARRAAAPDPADSAPPPEDEPLPESDALPDDAGFGAGADEAPSRPAVVPSRPRMEPEAKSKPASAPRPEKPVSTVSDDAAAVLREEAMRELKARLADGGRIETQPELGIVTRPDSPRKPARDAVPDPSAKTGGVARDKKTSAAVATVVASSRDLLPDIEEINSTLTSGPSGRTTERQPHRPQAGMGGRRLGFRIGFVAVVVLAVGAVGAYVYAPVLAHRYPEVGPALADYVAGADSLRVWWDVWVKDTVRSLTQMMSAATAKS